jgi:hypothetical protein
MSRKGISLSLQLASTAINAVLYVAVGVLWSVFPITVFGFRFEWQIFVPGAFAVIFGPWTGGVGAAIGIFFADIIYGHHDALLSLLVSVPSNFLTFFIIGWIAHKSLTRSVRRILLFVSLLMAVAMEAYGIVLAGTLLDPIVIGGLIGILTIIGLTALRNRWADFGHAASLGLGVGSVWIGFGIVGYSSFFALPAILGLGSGSLPMTFAYDTIVITYLSEIPFLVLLTPLVVAACRAAFPSLRFAVQSNETKPR